MTEHDRWYRQGSSAFSRVLNLSDALFAIALTLLVLGIDVPRAGGSPMAALVAQAPQLLAVAVSFAVIGYFWWVHHRFFALLRAVEPGIVACNLALLGAIALVPFTTGLLGTHGPTRGAVVPYLAVMTVVAVLHVLLLVRARAVDAFETPVPDDVWPYLVASWSSSAAVVVAALITAVWLPVVALVVLLATWPLEALVTRRAPATIRTWT